MDPIAMGFDPSRNVNLQWLFWLSPPIKYKNLSKKKKYNETHIREQKIFDL